MLEIHFTKYGGIYNKKNGTNDSHAPCYAVRICSDPNNAHHKSQRIESSASHGRRNSYSQDQLQRPSINPPYSI